MTKISLVCIGGGENGTSNKFWHGFVKGNIMYSNWGKIGTVGQEQVKDFPDAAAAEAKLASVVKSKLAKGYVVEENE